MAVEDDIFDGTVSNQIALRRYINRQVRLMLQLFESYDARLASLLRRVLRPGMRVQSDEFKKLVDQIKKQRSELMQRMNADLRKALGETAPVESDREWELLLALLALTSERPPTPGMREILDIPFAASGTALASLTEWVRTVRDADFRRIRDRLTLGVKEEQSTDEIVAGVVGTRDEEFRDGQVAVTRNNIRALVATAIVHVSHVVREAIWAGSRRVIGMLWVSILDTRTSVICRARDGKVVMFGDNPPPEGAELLDPPGARPPAHPNCRSGMMALTSDQLPARLTFDQWLRRQSRATQEDILGKTKAEMFRRGEVTLDQFVDNSGKEFTIEQLRAA